MSTYWSRGEFAELDTLLDHARLERTATETVLGHVTFPSIDALVHTEIQATPLAARIDDSTYSAITRSARSVLAEHVTADGEVRLPINARFIAGRRSD
jgi:hypothetical protein